MFVCISLLLNLSFTSYASERLIPSEGNHLIGEKSVCPMQPFFTRAPLNEAGILDTNQRLLLAKINHTGVKLSVDDTSVVKKGTHSIGIKRQYCGRSGKRENC